MEVFNGLKYTHIKEDIVNFRYLPIDLCLLPEEAEKVYGKDGFYIKRVNDLKYRFTLAWFDEFHKLFIPDEVYEELSDKYPLSKNVKKLMPPVYKYKCVVESYVDDPDVLLGRPELGRIVSVAKL
jgi:hypothetical protein